MREGPCDMGAACASIAEEPSPSRSLDNLFLGGSSRPIRHRRLGPSLPSTPRCRGDQGGRGTSAPHTIYKDGTLTSEGDAMARRQGSVWRETHRRPWRSGTLGTMLPGASWHDGDLGDGGNEGPSRARDQAGQCRESARATRDPSRQGTKVDDEMKTSSCHCQLADPDASVSRQP